MFDLDGTLLNMDLDMFGEIYFNEMALAFNGLIDKEKLVNSIWTATGEMVNNIEKRSNQDVFMEKFKKLVGNDVKPIIDRFDVFYGNGYLKTSKAFSKKEMVSDTLNSLKTKGYQLILATNPLFPKKAVKSRIAWAGIDPEIFSYISTYDNSSFCKPQIEYYNEILLKNKKRPEECLMVGNDVEEDMIAGNLGISTYLVDDQLISREKKIKYDYRGSFVDFIRFAKKLQEI